MRDHSHHSTDNTGYCAHCGQPLPGYAVPSYEVKRFNPAGIAVTLALHVLLVLLWVLKPQEEKKAPPPKSGGEITYVTPLPQAKPQPKEQPTITPKPTTQARPKPPTVARVRRLPDTITIPNEKPVREAEIAEPPKPVRPTAVAPETDMAAAIEARRRARGQTESEQPAEESAAERGMRIAKANIAAANGRSVGDDRNDTGGVFEVKKNAMTATVKFRGWNPSFKRRWLQEVTVELGNEKDIETAVIKKMIEIIRKEKTGDFEWDSHRLQRVVKMSARVEDTAELSDFLYKEMFPENRRGR
ncbi:hypothetical protein HF313_04350 [Massilia atriviolacea]|uniref:Uncharacterized protein n=1 Tax=Massilia atriviolacea TaxID=2495579 RepID=A0A430HD54_9BURK|nr:hypothetical protein [Massilia atriviolacea]RSZ55465.1 hypothetical protein EJB06_29075 [Massilia atriviolacea]